MGTFLADRLIGVGVILLLAQAGLIAAPDLAVVDLAPGFVDPGWPNLLVGRRSPLAGVLMGLATVAGMAIVLTYGAAWGLHSPARDNWPQIQIGSGPASIVKQHFEVPVGEAKSAEVAMSPGAAALTVGALAGSDNLLAAATEDMREVQLTSTAGAVAQIDMRHTADTTWGWWPAVQARSWQVELNRDVPLTLTLDAGSGASSLNLGDLNVTELTVDGGSGSVQANLPAGAWSATVDMGSGSLTAPVPEGADARMSLAMGSGSAHISVGQQSALALRLTSGGSGSLAIGLPADADVQVVVNDRGSGAVRLPDALQLGRAAAARAWAPGRPPL